MADFAVEKRFLHAATNPVELVKEFSTVSVSPKVSAMRQVKTARPTQPSRGGGDEDFPRVPTQMFAKVIQSEKTLFYLVVLHDFYLTEQMPTAIKFYR
jgi:hypothetical protein